MSSTNARSIVVALSPEGVIGLHGKIPWHYPADLRRFKRLTMGSTIVMGRKTWESIGAKPLPGRRNVVITSRSIPGVECFQTIAGALATATGPVWFIGGARIYEEALGYADRIDVTYVPDHVEDPEAVRFPPLDPAEWEAGARITHEDDPRLERREYKRRDRAPPAR